MNASRNTEFFEELDMEWTELILEARTLGLTIEEIRHFLQETSMKQNRDEWI